MSHMLELIYFIDSNILMNLIKTCILLVKQNTYWYFGINEELNSYEIMSLNISSCMNNPRCLLGREKGSIIKWVVTSIIKKKKASHKSLGIKVLPCLIQIICWGMSGAKLYCNMNRSWTGISPQWKGLWGGISHECFLSSSDMYSWW